MYVTSVYEAVEEVLNDYLQTTESVAPGAPRRPADAVLRHYIKQRRYIGSKDRQAIASLYYTVMREFAGHALCWRSVGGPRRTTAPEGGDGLQEASNDEDNFEVFCARDLLFSHFARHEGADFPRRLADAVEKANKKGYGWQPLTQEEELLYAAYVAFWAEQGTIMSSSPGHDVPHGPPEIVYGVAAPLLALIHEQVPSDRVESFLASLKEEAPTDCRINPLKVDRETMMRRFRKEGWEASPTPYSPFGIRLHKRYPITTTPWFKSGAIEIQDEGSQLLCLLCGVAPGSPGKVAVGATGENTVADGGGLRVLDYCAGAGGKSLLLGALMENKGHLVVTDVVPARLEEAVRRIRRAGLSNYQARSLTQERKWFKRQKGSFDCVLVDAPCSGSGTWRRHVDAKLHFTPTSLAVVCRMQQEILDQAAQFVKPGGRLVYATCSVFMAENDEQVKAFLERHPDFVVVPVPETFPLQAGQDYLQLYPSGEGGEKGHDGFFGAVLQRKISYIS